MRKVLSLYKESWCNKGVKEGKPQGSSRVRVEVEHSHIDDVVLTIAGNRSVKLARDLE